MHSRTRSLREKLPPFAVAFFLLNPAACQAAVTISFEQRGSDVVVTSTGNLNLTPFDWSWSSWENEDAYYRQIGSNLPQDLVRLFRDSVTSYEFPRGGNFFTVASPVLIADDYSGMTFGIWADSSSFALYVPRNFEVGTINSSMTFRNLNLASLGVIEQVIDLGSTDAQRLIITVVPEPAMASVAAITGMAMMSRRRRSLPMRDRMS
jgi:hypothetical protein